MNSVHCPICNRPMPGPGPQEWPEWPFCSARCQMVDLGRWLGEAYRLPAQDTETLSDEAENSSDDELPQAGRSLGRSP